MSAPAIPVDAPALARTVDGGRMGHTAMVSAFAISLFFGIPGGLLSMIDEAAFIVSFGLMVMSQAQIRFSFRAASLPLVLGAAGGLSSAIGNGWLPQTSHVVLTLALFAVVLGLVAPLLRDPRNLRTFTVVFVWVGVVSAVVTVLQHLEVVPLFGTTGANQAGESLRGAGFQGHTIWQSLILSAAAAAIPFAIRRRPVALAALCVIAAGIWATFSRAGWVGLIVAVLVWVALGPRQDDARFRRAGTAAIVGVMAISVALLFGAVEMIDEGSQARIDETVSSLQRFNAVGAEGLEQLDDRTSGEDRIVLLNGGLESIADNWTIGVGIGWRMWDIALRTGVARTAHNTYLSIVQLVGVPIGLAVLFLWARLLYRAVRATAWIPEARGPVAAVLGLAVGMLAVDTPLEGYFIAPWAIGVALAPSMRAASETA